MGDVPEFEVDSSAAIEDRQADFWETLGILVNVARRERSDVGFLEVPSSVFVNPAVFQSAVRNALDFLK